MQFNLLRKSSFAPERATTESACWDLRADLTSESKPFEYLFPESDAIKAEKSFVKPRQQGYLLRNNVALIVPTGVRLAIPKGKVGMIYSRSGMGVKQGVRLANAVGVIDSDYRDEIFVALTLDREYFQYVEHGDKIAQLMIIDCDVSDAEPMSASDFDEFHNSKSANRTGGLGSTGS